MRVHKAQRGSYFAFVFQVLEQPCVQIVDTVTGHGATRAEAIADAVRQANAWLVDHPGYRPRPPWITRDDHA